MPADRARAAQAIAAFLEALGHGPSSDPELAATPERVADAWIGELLDGYDTDVAKLLAAESCAAAETSPGLVAVRDVAVTTVCPHHLLPSRGTASVVYEPGARLAGIGAVARVVLAYAHRLTLQETIGANVASALVGLLGARGAACRLVLVHECMASRGERQAGASVESIAFAGAFAEPGPGRTLATSVLRGPRGDHGEGA